MPEGRFATDSSLAWLARRLRLLGYDVAVHVGARLEQVCDAARREGRVVLTLSGRVPPACAWVERCVVRRGEEASVLSDLVRRFAPAGPPFGRCVHCNTPLAVTAPDLVAEGAPPGVAITGRCPTCGRCYWHGSHVDRMIAWFEAALGRSLEPPGPGVTDS